MRFNNKVEVLLGDKAFDGSYYSYRSHNEVTDNPYYLSKAMFTSQASNTQTDIVTLATKPTVYYAYDKDADKNSSFIYLDHGTLNGTGLTMGDDDLLKGIQSATPKNEYVSIVDNNKLEIVHIFDSTQNVNEFNCISLRGANCPGLIIDIISDADAVFDRVSGTFKYGSYNKHLMLVDTGSGSSPAEYVYMLRDYSSLREYTETELIRFLSNSSSVKTPIYNIHNSTLYAYDYTTSSINIYTVKNDSTLYDNGEQSIVYELYATLTNVGTDNLTSVGDFMHEVSNNVYLSNTGILLDFNDNTAKRIRIDLLKDYGMVDTGSYICGLAYGEDGSIYLSTTGNIINSGYRSNIAINPVPFALISGYDSINKNIIIKYINGKNSRNITCKYRLGEYIDDVICALGYSGTRDPLIDARMKFSGGTGPLTVFKMPKDIIKGDRWLTVRYTVEVI